MANRLLHPYFLPVLIIWLVCHSGFVVAQERVDVCASPEMKLIGHANILEDATAELDRESVVALGDDGFYDISQRAPSWGHTSSAVWLDFRLQNRSDSHCERWLIVGEPRLENIQVYVGQDGSWRQERAGSAYPLETWSVPARQPRFKMIFEPGTEKRLLIRVTSRSSLLINPQLKDEQSLIKSVTDRQLIDGFVLGMIFLVLAIAFAVGYVTRFYLLLINAFALLFYSLVILVVNGYLIYTPSLLPWTRELIGLLSFGTASFYYLFFYVLFRVRRMGTGMNVVFAVYTSVVAFVLFAGAFEEPLAKSDLYSFLRYGGYPLALVLTLAAIIRGVRLPWFAWLFSIMMLIQGAQWVWWQMGDHIWRFGDDEFDLIAASALLATLLSALIFAVVRLRRHEREAVAEISFMQHAENERLEKQVALRTEQLRESLQARSSLLARVSHDLRGPLNRIVNTARQLKAEVVPGEISKVERIALQQIEFIDDLLQFSKNELHQMELVLEPGYLFGFLREIEDEGAFLASRQGNRLSCSLADDLPALVQADFRQLRRVLINLLNNAAKFTRDGSIVLKVECLERKGKQCALAFSVQDTGTGFPQGSEKHLLLPFHRGLNAKQAEGHGLGLSIVGDLLEQMGAKLVMSSQEGKGSTFRFDLWLNMASEDEIDSVFTESHLMVTGGGGHRLLVVDDIEFARLFLGDLFAGYGFEVSLAASVDEALSILATDEIDLVITDQFMPDVDGWALLDNIRRSSPGLPVLLYSAHPPKNRDDARALDFDATLIKPASSEELLACVERLCGEWPQARLS
ncbi:hybrid sensor histidine kinase/response regulator [Marinobacter sp. F3R08]|uniref:hybrid sensor histidine kinase/response regulator n=1 Tax=Marinobacter sp. F3R08 TaxID=2841559 RepID=UPI001C09FA50|nr:hybrid sensor histidine kinase/response regulator [Marinobacter sp. F3R08]MBU2954819.1 response regulator [Marinobacter sp. F3R08]